MKQSVFFIIIMLVTTTLSGQDLIVTNSGDSINCIITKVKKEYIYFTYEYENEIRNTLIQKDEINVFKRDHFKNYKIIPSNIIRFQKFEQLRFAINTGFGYQTAKINKNVSEEFHDYVRRLKSGMHFDADFHYYTSEIFGFGLKYILFHSSSSKDKVLVRGIGENTNWVEMSDKLNITFIGPSVSTRFYNNDKSGAFLINYAIGYAGYRDKSNLKDEFIIKGSSLGNALTVGYDFEKTKKTNFGVQLTFSSGVVKSYTEENDNNIRTYYLDKDEYESLARIDLSVGIRF